MRPATDVAEVLIPGPWRHRYVAANGGRFHVAECGDGPPVLLLHGFPQFWWTWRHLLPALAAAGHRAIALDLRGYGASDKPPRGYDTPTLAADVAGVARSLGEDRVAVVGAGWGAWLAWAMPTLHPALVRGIVPVAMPHPLTLRRGRALTPAAVRLLALLQLPVLPERRLTRSGVPDLLAAGAGPAGLPPHVGHTYARAMRLPFVAHTSLEYHRWAVRSPARSDGRRFAAALRAPIGVPVLQVHGACDPWIAPGSARADVRYVTGEHRFELVASAGHFVPDEAPAALAELILDWLPGLPS